MKKIELNSNLLPLIDVGMYGTALDFSEVFSSDIEEGYVNESNEDTLYENYRKYLAETAQEFIDEYFLPTFKKYGVEKIVVTGLWSPTSYNYTNDELNFEIYVSDDWAKWVEPIFRRVYNDGRVQEYAKTNYRDYPGYWNYMPETLEECLKFEDFERCSAEILTLCMVYEDKINANYQDVFECEVYENSYEVFNM